MQDTRDTDPNLHTDELVVKAIHGDEEAFGKIYDLHVDRIYRHIYYRVSSKEEAEDLTQQVFINAWKALPRFKKTSSPFLAWLMTISHNLIVNYYRSRKDKEQLSTEITAGDLGSDPEKLAEVNFEQEWLKAAISQLPEEQQQVIMMSFVEGFTGKEIAAAMGKKEGAVRVLQHRGLKKIREMKDGRVS